MQFYLLSLTTIDQPKKLAYNGRTARKQGSCLEKEIMQGTMAGACRRGRVTTHGLDGQHQDVDRTLREMTEDRDKWSNYVYGVANPRIEDGWRTGQTIQNTAVIKVLDAVSECSSSSHSVTSHMIRR